MTKKPFTLRVLPPKQNDPEHFSFHQEEPSLRLTNIEREDKHANHRKVDSSIRPKNSFKIFSKIAQQDAVEHKSHIKLQEEVPPMKRSSKTKKRKKIFNDNILKQLLDLDENHQDNTKSPLTISHQPRATKNSINYVETTFPKRKSIAPMMGSKPDQRQIKYQQKVEQFLNDPILSNNNQQNLSPSQKNWGSKYQPPVSFPQSRQHNPQLDTLTKKVPQIMERLDRNDKQIKLLNEKMDRQILIDKEKERNLSQLIYQSQHLIHQQNADAQLYKKKIEEIQNFNRYRQHDDQLKQNLEVEQVVRLQNLMNENRKLVQQVMRKRKDHISSMNSTKQYNQIQNRINQLHQIRVHPPKPKDNILSNLDISAIPHHFLEDGLPLNKTTSTKKSHQYYDNSTIKFDRDPPRSRNY